MAARRLTDLSVERFRPNDKRAEIPDGVVTGLLLVMQPTGAKSWAIRSRIEGRPIKMTLGEYPRLDLKAAREAARRALEIIDRGGDPRQEREEQRRVEATRRANTFRAVAIEFVERYCKANQPRSWRETLRTFELHLFPDWGDRPFDAIRRGDLHRVLDGLEVQGIAGTSHHVVSAVTKLYNWAVDRELVAASPFVRMRRHLPAPRQRVLSDNEVRALWGACLAQAYPFGDFVRLLLLTGARRTELAALRWDEVDLDRGAIVIPRARFKTGRAHVIPLSAMAREAFDALPRLAGGPFCFTTTGGAKPISGFSKFKAALDRRLQEPIDYDLHDLRRTCRTGLAQIRTRPDIAERVLGHTQRGIAVHYDQWEYFDEKREALAAWAGYVERLLNPVENVVPLRK